MKPKKDQTVEERQQVLGLVTSHGKPAITVKHLIVLTRKTISK